MPARQPAPSAGAPVPADAEAEAGAPASTAKAPEEAAAVATPTPNTGETAPTPTPNTGAAIAAPTAENPNPPTPTPRIPAAGSWPREPETVVRRTGTIPAAGHASAIRTESEAPATPLEWEPHAHAMHELVWVRGGTMTTRVGDRVFTVSEGAGLWLPAGAEHGGRVTGGVEFFDAFFAPERTPVRFDGPTVIAMTPLLEALLTHLARPDLGEDERGRAEAVVFDVLTPAAEPLALRVAGDGRIDAIAEALLADPADPRGLEEWARQSGLSERTITRGFRQSTGLSFAQWRQVLRVHRALALLDEGWDVQTISERLGYAQPSTFIAAFRKVMGTTPGAYASGR